MSIPLALALLFAADQKLPARPEPPATTVIKSLGIIGPVTGGHPAPGRVEMESSGVVPSQRQIQLSSSNPALAAVPEWVNLAQGTNAVAFAITTTPFACPWM